MSLQQHNIILSQSITNLCSSHDLARLLEQEFRKGFNSSLFTLHYIIKAEATKTSLVLY